MSAHPIPAAALAQHLVILGKTGSGKTWAAKTIVENLLGRDSRVCILDPTGAWYGLRTRASGKPGFKVAIFGGPHADFPIAQQHGEELAEIIGTSNTPAIIDVSQMRTGERTRFFTDFAEGLLRKNRGPLHLVVDEAHLFAPQGRVNDPQSGAMLHAANNLVSLGRSRGLRIMLITQRPAKLHKDSLTQVETLIAMRLIAPQDRKAVEEWIKDNADPKIGQEVISSLATLKTGQGWIWAPELEILERITFPKITTLDTSRAPDGTEVAIAPLPEIDRGAIGARLKDVAKAAADNDPKRLKARIAELERDAKRQPAVSTGHTEAYVREREALGEKNGYERGHTAGFDKGYDAAIDRVLLQIDGIQKPSAPPPATLTIHAQRPVRPATARALAETAQAAAKVLRAPVRDLPPPQQKLLDKLAWLEHKGIYPAAKETLAAIAGVSPTSGGYFNNLGKLRSAALIEYPQAGTVAFTPQGRDFANLEDDGRAVHEHWLEILPAPQRTILAKLIDRHGRDTSKDELAHFIGVSPSSGGYFNNLGRLRTLGAIDYPRPGYVALTEHVMP